MFNDLERFSSRDHRQNHLVFSSSSLELQMMSEANTKSSATPPVRSIAGERRTSMVSSSVESKSSAERPTKSELPSEKNRERFISSSSSSSYTYESSSNGSLRSYTVQRWTPDDDESPNNETYESLSTIQEQLHSLRQMSKVKRRSHTHAHKSR